jgi:solute carrier family 25 carnitine/acylcarnitine transporter 20/29
MEAETTDVPAVNSWKDFVAGNIGGMAGLAAGHPFDTVKVRIQSQPKVYSSNAIKTLTKIIRNEGMLGLFKGMEAPVLGVGFINALVFGVFGNSYRYLEGRRQEVTTTSKYIDTYNAGCAAGFASCLISSPVELVKTRLQIQDGHTKQVFKGPMDCTIQTLNHEGPKGLFRGMTATIIRDVPSYGVYFGFYEVAKSVLGTSHVGLMLAGGTAGVVAWVFAYPSDVIKTRIQSVPLKHTRGWDRYKGVIDCTKQTYREGGVRILFRGLNSCVLRAFPTNAVTFLVYEMLMRYL